MIKKLLFALLALTVFATPSHAGRKQPVYNIHDAHILTSSGGAPTLDQVQQAFQLAANEKGWQVRVVEPGHLVASINVRRHFAQIDVKFSPQQYSILYKDSQVLKYDGQEIHRNYNKWIKLLDEKFRQNLLRY